MRLEGRWGRWRSSSPPAQNPPTPIFLQGTPRLTLPCLCQGDDEICCKGKAFGLRGRGRAGTPRETGVGPLPRRGLTARPTPARPARRRRYRTPLTHASPRTLPPPPGARRNSRPARPPTCTHAAAGPAMATPLLRPSRCAGAVRAAPPPCPAPLRRGTRGCAR